MVSYAIHKEITEIEHGDMAIAFWRLALGITFGLWFAVTQLITSGIDSITTMLVGFFFGWLFWWLAWLPAAVLVTTFRALARLSGWFEASPPAHPSQAPKSL
jgi:hypothetical protein